MISCSDSIQMRATFVLRQHMSNDKWYSGYLFIHSPPLILHNSTRWSERFCLGSYRKKQSLSIRNSFTISEGRSDPSLGQVNWNSLWSWIISFFSSTSPTLIRHSAQKARKESNWSLSKVKSVCPLSLAPFVPFARLSDFHKIVKWIYEPESGRNREAGKAQPEE